MRFLFLVAALALAGCKSRAVSSKATDNSEIKVEKLFTVDGCTVYRFMDGFDSYYFSKCVEGGKLLGSAVTWNEKKHCGKGCTHDPSERADDLLKGAGALKQACKNQCKQCPFRKRSLPGWLGNYDVGAVINALWNGIPFLCHTRTNYKRPDWREYAQRNGKLCVGGLLATHDWKFPVPQDPEIAAAQAKAIEMRSADPDSFEVMRAREFGTYHQRAGEFASL